MIDYTYSLSISIYIHVSMYVCMYQYVCIACVDLYGRVIVTEAHSCAVLRIWKGYRGAQVAWLNCVERWENQVQHI